jgi:hypothetical protein
MSGRNALKKYIIFYYHPYKARFSVGKFQSVQYGEEKLENTIFGLTLSLFFRV